MKRMAAGDGAAPFELLASYYESLAKSVCSILHAVGRRDVASRRAEVDYLVQGAALVLFDRAAGWRSDGALPWVWAYASIRAEVVAWIGHPSVEFEPRFHVMRSCDNDLDSSDIDLRELAVVHGEIADWLRAVDVVANERDREVHLEYQVQKHLGDRSPAHTVSAMFSLSPANVRQIDTRVRRRLAGQPDVGALAAAL